MLAFLRRNTASDTAFVVGITFGEWYPWSSSEADSRGVSLLPASLQWTKSFAKQALEHRRTVSKSVFFDRIFVEERKSGRLSRSKPTR